MSTPFDKHQELLEHTCNLKFGPTFYLFDLKFSQERLLELWCHYICSVNKENREFFKRRNEKYLENPDDNLYKKLEPLFQRILSSSNDIQLWIYNEKKTHSIIFSNTNGNIDIAFYDDHKSPDDYGGLSYYCFNE